MKKNVTKVLSLLIILTVVFSSIQVHAATGKEGFAIYRNGVAVIEWHAGLMDEPYRTNTLPVVHHSGQGYVKYDSWNNFLFGNTFQGYRQPKSGISSAGRDKVKAMGRRLRTENISYTFLREVQVPSTIFKQNYIWPEDITKIRCDGVVEYAYEWHGYKLQGGDFWDISKAHVSYYEAHNSNFVTPKKQFYAMKAA